MMHHPKRLFYGQGMQTTMSVIHAQLPRLNERLDGEAYQGRRVLGYKLPDWQRPAVWSSQQCVAFIESVWMGANIGSFMVNMSHRYKDLDNILLDGQQRLLAIEKYWADAFPIIGEDGEAYFWSQLEEREQAHFMRIPFPWIMTEYDKEVLLKNAYNRHNFGGTAHTLDQMAPV